MKKRMILATLVGVLAIAAIAYANVTKREQEDKEIVTNITETILISEAKSNFSKVQREIEKDEAEIMSDEKKLAAEIEEDRVKYRDKPLKLAEKEREYKADLEELNFDKRKLQFKKNNIARNFGRYWNWSF